MSRRSPPAEVPEAAGQSNTQASNVTAESDDDDCQSPTEKSPTDKSPAAYTIKQAEGILPPKSALANPMPSRRSSKHVAFDEEPHETDEPAGDQTGDRLLSGVSLSSYGLNSLTADRSTEVSGTSEPEVVSLKKTVRRLTAELSRLLISGRSSSENEDEVRMLLPGKGPVPPWLCDTRVLAPLLASAEYRLESSERRAARVEEQLTELQQRVQEVVRENDRLRLKLRDGQTGVGGSQSEWNSLKEQARLVLEENQLMIHQLSLQHERAKQARKGHAAEASRLRSRVEELETENSDAKEEVDRLRTKLQELKRKYQSAVMDREDEDVETVDRVKTLSRELLTMREEHKQATDELLHQLQVAERERCRLTDLVADAAADKEKLSVEVLSLKNSLQSKHRDNLVLQKFAKKHNSLQQYLDSVVTAANNLQSERDSYKEALEMQEKEFGHLVSQLVNELKVQSALSDAKVEDLQGVKKLEGLVHRLLQLLKDSEGKREEAEQQVKYMQSLLKQKQQQLDKMETEKFNVEQQLETAWNRAMGN